MNIAAAHLCFQLHVHFRYSVTRSCEQLFIMFATVSSNYVMLCVLVPHQLYAHLYAFVFHLQIHIKLVSAIL
jgi:hypothetical protein